MKTILFAIFALAIARVHAEISQADSPIFPLETGSFITTGNSNSFALDVRGIGQVGSNGSATFALNTLSDALTDLEIVGSTAVVAGSQTEYRVICHAGFSDIDVTADARWRFLNNPPGNTGMVHSTFYAGETNAPATVQIVASYLAATGQSKESPPFSITITPHLKTRVSSTQTATGKFTLNATPSGRPSTRTSRALSARPCARAVFLRPLRVLVTMVACSWS
jgi:hypothetical protein